MLFWFVEFFAIPTKNRNENKNPWPKNTINIPANTIVPMGK